jgi:diguanylate cyclase (GGDEF)-like protein
MADSPDNPSCMDESLLRQVIDLSSEGILVLQGDSETPRICYANSQFTRLSGFTLDELLTLHWADVCRDICAGDISGTLLSRDSYCGTLLMEAADGTRWQSGVRIRALMDDNGKTGNWLCQFVPPALMGGTDSDIATIWFDPDCASTRQRFGRLDRIDSSSGLLRFERFRDFLERDIAMAAREKKSVTLVALRIMEFSEYRCTFGVNAANSCLGMIGQQVTASLRRRTDLCARMNDDTIVVAVIGQSPKEMSSIVERICENVEGLRIHNPRGRYGRFLALRSGISAAEPVSRDCTIDSLLDSALAELEAATAETLTA